MNPTRRSLYRDFEAIAHNVVPLFRANAARRVGEARYVNLVSALLQDSPEFEAVWTRRSIAPMAPCLVEMFHPGFGEMRVSSVRLPCDASNDAMVVFLVPEDEPTAVSFRGWLAGEGREPLE